MKQTIYILRHAEKEAGDFFNPYLRHQDEPISARGRDSARKLCAYFAEIPLAAVYISEYQRTGQTAEWLARQSQLTPVVDARLNEIDNGCIDKMPDEKVKQEYPEVWQAYTARTADFRFPQGETGAEAQMRIASLLDEVRQKHAKGNILLVCHEGLIRLMMCHVLNLPVYSRWNFYVDFCGITEITYQPAYAAWKLLRFNQVVT